MLIVEMHVRERGQKDTIRGVISAFHTAVSEKGLAIDAESGNTLLFLKKDFDYIDADIKTADSKNLIQHWSYERD